MRNTISARHQFLSLVGLIAVLSSCTPSNQDSPVQLVDPLIGTGVATTESARRHSEADRACANSQRSAARVRHETQLRNLGIQQDEEKQLLQEHRQ